MTPEERAVIEAAQRVSCWADEAPSERFTEALAELDAALAVHDRVAEPYWWQGPKPALPLDRADEMPNDHEGCPGAECPGLRYPDHPERGHYPMGRYGWLADS